MRLRERQGRNFRRRKKGHERTEEEETNKKFERRENRERKTEKRKRERRKAKSNRKWHPTGPRRQEKAGNGGRGKATRTFHNGKS